MLIECKDIQLSKGYIPAFNLNGGEIVVLHLHGDIHYYDIKTELLNILSGTQKNDSVKILNPLKFVGYFFESKLRRLFCPVNVGAYIKKNANHANSIAAQFYNFPHADYDMGIVTENTKVNSLEGTSRKALTLYSTLSHSKNITFDLDGISRKGSIELYEIIKQNVKDGGAAILIDWSDEFKHDCSKFISIQFNNNK